MNPLDYSPIPQPPRPPILTILCTLTFVGALLSVLAHGLAAWDFSNNYWERTLAGETQQDFVLQFFDDAPFIENIAVYSRAAYIETATALLRLLAALLMWRQKIYGLILYVIVSLVSLFTCFYALSVTRIIYNSYTQWFPYISSYHLSIFFVICYFSQTKYLRW
jgi:hypothetical protein